MWLKTIISRSEKMFHANIELETAENTDFRRVLFTTNKSQLVLMSLRPGEDIGEEVHNVDQFFRFESGTGEVISNQSTQKVSDGDCVVIPSGTKHNIVNTGKKYLKLYTIYSPPHHKDGTVHHAKSDAENSLDQHSS